MILSWLSIGRVKLAGSRFKSRLRIKELRSMTAVSALKITRTGAMLCNLSAIRIMFIIGNASKSIWKLKLAMAEKIKSALCVSNQFNMEHLLKMRISNRDLLLISRLPSKMLKTMGTQLLDSIKRPHSKLKVMSFHLKIFRKHLIIRLKSKKSKVYNYKKYKLSKTTGRFKPKKSLIKRTSRIKEQE